MRSATAEVLEVPADTDHASPEFDKCPTCDLPRGHRLRVTEYAMQLRREHPEAYAIVDQIKREWKS